MSTPSSTVVALCLLLAAATKVHAAEKLEVIKASDPQYSGHAKRDYPAGVVAPDFFNLEVESFEGGWANGLAEGEGLLMFKPVPTTGYMSTIQAFSEKRSYYQGQFHEGRPVGPGRLALSDGTYVQTLDGLFTDREVVMGIENQPVAVLTSLPGQNKVLVRAMQYLGLGVRQPSRMYFGEIRPDGTQTGEWVDVPWFADNGDHAVAGYGRFIEFTDKSGEQLSCELAPRPADPPNLLKSLMSQVQGYPAIAQLVATIDQQFMGQKRAKCKLVNSSGWSWVVDYDFTVNPSKPTFLSCKTPDGKKGKLRSGGRRCEEHSDHKHDIFTNIGEEFMKFVDRRIIGSLDRAGGSVERAMCRATGTEPGKNCNVGMQIGASWPIGDGPAPGLPAEEQAVRTAYINANRRAKLIPDSLGDAALGSVIAMDADMNAICSALCSTQAQRTYSASLLTELEAVAATPVTEDTYIRVRALNRETASLLGAGIRTVVIIGPIVSAAVPFYGFIQKGVQDARIDVALDKVDAHTGASNFDYLVKRERARATLYNLKMANLSSMGVQGGRLLTAYISSSIRMLKNYPPETIGKFTAAISVGRTPEQVREFVEKYKDVKTEKELYDALIREALAPLNIPWHPR